jgi:hypothetical protein
MTAIRASAESFMMLNVMPSSFESEDWQLTCLWAAQRFFPFSFIILDRWKNPEEGVNGYTLSLDAIVIALMNWLIYLLDLRE